MTKLEKVYMTILVLGIIVTLCIELLVGGILLGIVRVIQCIGLMLMAVMLDRLLQKHKEGILEILDFLFLRDEEDEEEEES